MCITVIRHKDRNGMQRPAKIYKRTGQKNYLLCNTVLDGDRMQGSISSAPRFTIPCKL